MTELKNVREMFNLTGITQSETRLQPLKVSLELKKGVYYEDTTYPVTEQGLKDAVASVNADSRRTIVFTGQITRKADGVVVIVPTQHEMDKITELINRNSIVQKHVKWNRSNTAFQLFPIGVVIPK